MCQRFSFFFCLFYFYFFSAQLRFQTNGSPKTPNCDPTQNEPTVRHATMRLTTDTNAKHRFLEHTVRLIPAVAESVRRRAFGDLASAMKLDNRPHLKCIDVVRNRLFIECEQNNMFDEARVSGSAVSSVHSVAIGDFYRSFSNLLWRLPL